MGIAPDSTSDHQRDNQGFSFTEILVAVALLALCLLPVMNLSTSTVRESSLSREDILARHLLMDLVERYRDSDLDELERLPVATTLSQVPPGQDDPEIARDPILKERTARLLASVHGASGTSEGLSAYRGIYGEILVSRSVGFEKNSLGPGRHLLTCAVRWSAKSGKNKYLEFGRLLVRQ